MLFDDVTGSLLEKDSPKKVRETRRTEALKMMEHRYVNGGANVKLYISEQPQPRCNMCQGKTCTICN
jgi:hypothetical protein